MNTPSLILTWVSPRPSENVPCLWRCVSWRARPTKSLMSINQWTRARQRLTFGEMKCFLHQTLLERTYLATQVDIRGVGLIPRLGRSAGGRHGNLLHCSCLENPMNREAQWWLQSWAWNIYQYTTDDGSLLGGLQSLESLRVGPGWVTNHTHTHTHTQLMTIMGKFKIKTWIGFKWLFLIYIKKL